MKIRKNQAGAGIIPLLYNPIQPGGVSSSPAVSSQKEPNDNNLLDDSMIKELAAKALPSDMQAFIDKSDIFKDSLFSGIGTDYAGKHVKSLLVYLNKMSWEKDTFQKAVDHIKNIEGSSEIAITSNNGVFVQRDGKLKEVSVSDIKEGESPLTNSQLAQLRANTFAFDTNMTQALYNATSMKEIRGVIEKVLSGLGYLKQGSQELGILEETEDITLEDMRNMGFNDLVKNKAKSSTNIPQIKFAVSAIYKQLTPSQRVLLANRVRETKVKDTSSLIFEFIISRAKEESSIGLDTTKSSKSKGSGVKNPTDDLPYNEAIQLITGRGFNQPISFHEGTQAQITTNGTHSLLTSKTGESVGQKAATHMLDSSLAAALDFTNISIAGAKIDQEGLNRIMIRDANVIGVDMPFTVTEDGTIIPDINLTKKVQEVEQYIRENNITDIAQINKLYIDSKLPIKFIGVDAMGNPILNTTNYRRFMGLNVIADKSAFDDDLIIDLNRSLKRVKSDVRLKDFQNVMRETSYDDKFKYTDPWGFWADPEVYEGVLWTPLKTNALQAYLGAEENITVAEAESIERAEQEKQIIASAPERYRTINQADYGI